jgi:hypothetical protein
MNPGASSGLKNGASTEELNLIFASAEALCEGGLKERIKFGYLL